MLNLETKMRLESIGKMYEELKVSGIQYTSIVNRFWFNFKFINLINIYTQIKNELLADQVQLYADRKTFSNDDYITVINANLDK